MDQKSFENLILTVQSDLHQFKSSLTPCLVLLNEILEIRKKRNLAENSNHSLLSMLVLEIKTDLLKDIKPLFASSDEVYVLRDKLDYISRNQEEENTMMKQVIFTNEQEIQKQTESLNKIKFSHVEVIDRLSEVNQKMDDYKHQLDTKATLSNLTELRQLVKNCATVPAFEMLKHRVNDCASKYQVDEMHKSQASFAKKIKKFTRTKDLEKSLKEFQEQVLANLGKDFITKEKFSDEKHGIFNRFAENDEKVNDIDTKIDRCESALTMKIVNFKKKLDSEPWGSVVEEIKKDMMFRATYEDFSNYKSAISNMMIDCNSNIEKFRKTINNFEAIVARFDEILLTKAEKNDVKRLDGLLKLCLERTEFENFKVPTNENIEKIQDAIKKMIQSADIMDSHLEIISNKCNNVIKDNIDVSIVAKNLSDLKELLSNKANKEDIYEIYDLMGRKSEIMQIYEFNTTFRKQLELAVVLIQSLCRTLIKTGENNMLVQKKREELLGNFNNLVNWVSNENTSGQNTKTLFGSKYSELVSNDVEERGRLLKSRNGNKRKSISSRIEQKITVDFPKIKMV